MTSLVELRILEGPNLYFPRAAVKLTLDVSTITEAGDEDALAVEDSHVRVLLGGGRRRDGQWPMPRPPSTGMTAPVT